MKPRKPEKPRRGRERSHKYWTRDEVVYLTKHWRDHERKTIRQRLRRAWTAIMRKAKTLGLQRGTPQGFETLKAAAQRKLVSPDYLLRILRHFEVPIRKPYGNRNTESKRANAFYIEIDAVDEAWEGWVQLWSFSRYAEERGLHRVTLWRLLEKAGHPAALARRRRASGYWKQSHVVLDPKEIDPLVEEFRRTRHGRTGAIISVTHRGRRSRAAREARATGS